MKRILKLFTFGIITFMLFGVTNVFAMQIFIKMPSDKTFTLDVENSDTISDIKGKIQDKKEIAPNQQSLFYESNQLEDEKSLGYYNIQKEQTIDLIYQNNIIEVDDDENGVITPDKSTALEKEVVTLTVTPSEGYKLKKINGVTTTKVNNTTYTFVMPNESVNISAEYEKISYTLTINNVDNVTMSSTGLLDVAYGENKEITITANTGYKLKKVLINDVEQNLPLSNNVLVLNNIQENKTIVVEVEKDENQIDTVDNPNTGDEIISSVLLGSISLIGLLGTSIYLKKRRFN